MQRYELKSDNARFRDQEVLRVRLLGRFQVSVGDRTIEDDEWRLRNAGGLIKLLALAPGHRMHRDRILDLLWPNLEPRAAANNLYHTLHVARRILGVESLCLRLEDDRLSLYPEGPVWTDVEAFEAAADMARRNRDPVVYRTAIERYTGELLTEDRYEDWVEGRSAELQNTYQELLVELSRMHEARGEIEPAVEALRRIVADTPEHEEAQAGLVRLYALSGQRYQALRQYEQLKDALRKKFDAEPDGEIQHLYEEILAGRVRTIQPSSDTYLPPEATKHNLPAALTSFVGREREVEEVERLLDESRLLTLTGPGGCGKTRLALSVASDLVREYPDGVWLVELSSLGDPDLIPQAVAGALSVYEQPGHPLLDTLVHELRSKKSLLVLDNCEHLIEATALLAGTLLRSCPGLRILATSREVLNVPGEANLAVAPLSVPEPGHPVSVEGLGEFGAVRLFLERARYRRPGFVLTEETAASVAEICRRLDGIPLAVELAAARVGVLSVEQISTRLDDALDLLTTGSRVAEPRQRTLRGALDWGHELLDEEERKLFRRLSVFAGGWTLEAGEAVGAGNGIEREVVLDLLSHLVDKSLVTAGIDREGASRYGMLETVRRYARERLEESGEEKQARRCHALGCLEFAGRAEQGLTGPEQPLWLDRLENEHDNLRAALGWALDEAGGDGTKIGLELAAALWLFWDTHGHLVEGREWLQRALDRDKGKATRARAKAQGGAGWISVSRGEYEAAIPLIEDSLSIYRALEDEEGIAAALVNLGFAALFGMRQDMDLPGLLEEAMRLRPGIKNHRTLGMLLIFAGLMRETPESGQKGEILHEESLELFRGVRDTWGMSTCLMSLGIMALRRGNHDRASSCLQENLVIARDLDKKKCISYSLFGLASLAANQDRPMRAARLWAASENVFDAAGLQLSPLARADVCYEEILESVRTELGDEVFRRAWAEGRAMTQKEATEYALEKTSSVESTGSEGVAALSRREKEVAVLVARGLTNREISASLVISRRTAENHVSRILKKLNIGSREELAAWVVSLP